jgi:hypothetical protein
MTGDVTITGTIVAVSVHATWTPVFLSAIGITDLHVTAHATARPVTALEGTERR